MNQLPRLSGVQSRRGGRRQGILRLLGVAAASAWTLTGAVHSSHFEGWSIEDGLPVGFVANIAQTPDSYLWLTTREGLVRFDGMRLAIFNKANTPGISSNRFTSLFVDREGTLWAGTESSGVVRHRDGAFVTLGAEYGLLDNRVHGIAQDQEGRLLVVAGDRVSYWNGHRFEADATDKFRTPDTHPFLSKDGHVYQADSTGLYRVDSRGRSARLMPAGPIGTANLTILEDGPESFWLGVAKRGLYHVQGSAAVSYGTREGLPDVPVRDLRFTPSGDLWVSTDGGVMRWSGGRFISVEDGDDLARFGPPSHLFVDREGSLWVSRRKGIAVLRNWLITGISQAEGLGSENTYPILEDGSGVVWVGTWPGLNRIRDGSIEQVASSDGKTPGIVSALAEDRAGGLWVGTFGLGIWRVRNGLLSQVLRLDQVHANGVEALLEDRTGNLWVGTTNGVYWYRDGVYGSPPAVPDTHGQSACALLEDRDGAIWIGTQELIRVRGGSATVYGKSRGFSGQVRCLYEDASHTIWIGTYDSGLYRWKDGALVSIGVKDGLFDPGVFQILEDDRGYFWISCNHGIYRVAKQQLDDFAAGRIKTILSVGYGREDGMREIECNGGAQPAGWKRKNGELWFATQNGVAVIHPERMVVSTQAPVVHVEGALLDRAPQDMASELRIPSGKDTLEILYTGITFLRPDLVRFRYRMKGLDGDWVDAGNRRVAYYSHIPPGQYVFEVSAANRDGVWTAEPVRLAVTGIPPYWHTPGFMLLVAINLVAVCALLYYRRIQMWKAKQVALEAFSRSLIESQEAERKRIATELHDSLGQELMVIKNQAALALREAPVATRERLDGISVAASQAIEEVRSIAYALRPFQLDRLGLTRAVESMLAKISGSSGIRFTRRLDPLDGLFPRESEISLYRIVQEGVNNVVRHSEATEARVEIHRDSDSVSITIADNGRGFAFDPGQTGLGLIGITERARLLGGTSRIISSPGAGTNITIRIGCEGDKHERRDHGPDRRRSSDLSKRSVASGGG